MLAYIKGKLEMKMSDYIVIDINGLGYKVFMSGKGIENIGPTGNEVKVHTHYRVREDDISIYGFNTIEELKLFELLLSVSGVGAKTALTMLAVIEPSQFALAVISEDVTELTTIPGIGPKSAKRIILELKDKLKKEEAIKELECKGVQNIVESNNKLNEAISALQVLGYNRKEVEKAICGLEKDDLTVEEIIKKGLLMLGR